MLTREEFDQFCETMWERYVEGNKKHGDDFLEVSIREELQEELVDVANYAFMLAAKLKKKFGEVDE